MSEEGQGGNGRKHEAIPPHMRRALQRKELVRQIQIYAWLTALLEVQTPNVNIRRELEELEATEFVARKSIQVEMSRERVQQHRQQAWQNVEVLVDLLIDESSGAR